MQGSRFRLQSSGFRVQGSGVGVDCFLKELQLLCAPVATSSQGVLPSLRGARDAFVRVTAEGKLLCLLRQRFALRYRPEDFPSEERTPRIVLRNFTRMPSPQSLAIHVTVLHVPCSLDRFMQSWRKEIVGVEYRTLTTLQV